MPGPPLYRYPPVHQPRPINPLDNASTTGLYANPNGTYIANSFPTTAQSGARGAFAAGLPTVRVSSSTPNNMFGAALQNGSWAPSQPLTGAPGTPFVPMVGYIQPKLPQQPLSRLGANYGPGYRAQPSLDPEDPRGRGSSVLDSYNYQRRTGQLSTDVMQYVINNPKAYDDLSPAQREAVDRIIQTKQGQGGGAGPGGTPGEGQFYGYVRNEETGRSERVIKDSSTSSFSKELRWDPDRKKYVEIGKLMKEGKLDKKGGWHKKRGGGGGSKNSSPAPGPRAGWTGSYGVVQFNTGTG